MNYRDHGLLQDDFDVEIGDIPDFDDPVPNDKSLEVTSRSLLLPRFSARQRALQLLMTIGIVAMALCLVLGSSIPVRNLAVRVPLVGTLFSGLVPISVGAGAPDAELFYIDRGLPWAHISLDGHPIAHLPVIGVDPPFRFTNGHHQLLWRADPFQSQTCTITIPLDLGAGVCLFNASVQLKSGVTAWIVRFFPPLDTLSDVQSAALIHASQVALDAQQSTEIVRPGELYNRPTPHGIGGSTGVINHALTHQPLRATLHFQLDTSKTGRVPCVSFGHFQHISCLFLGQSCQMFCTTPMGVQPALSPTRGWVIYALVRSAWKYTTAEGQIIARDQPDASGSAMGYDHFVPLQVAWDRLTGWHVTILSATPNDPGYVEPGCASAQDEVNMNFALRNVTIHGELVDWRFIPGTVHAAGCLAVAIPRQSGVSTPTPSPHMAAYFLHRFGLLLAANDVAHRIWPYIPMADAYEQKLAQQLATSHTF